MVPIEASDEQSCKCDRVRWISKLIDIKVDALTWFVQILRISLNGPAVNIGNLLDSFLFFLPCNLSFDLQLLLEVIFEVVLILIFWHCKADTYGLISKLVPS